MARNQIFLLTYKITNNIGYHYSTILLTSSKYLLVMSHLGTNSCDCKLASEICMAI